MTAEATRAQREERAVAVCRDLTAAIGELAPEGLGRWPGAWRIVRAPSEAFLDALQEYERTGGTDAKRSVNAAYLGVLEAWRLAAAEWERAGRPEREGVTA